MNENKTAPQRQIIGTGSTTANSRSMSNALKTKVVKLLISAFNTPAASVGGNATRIQIKVKAVAQNTNKMKYKIRKQMFY